MTRRLPVLFAAVFSVGAFGQLATAPSHYGSFTGFGNINYPGVGHAPNVIYPSIFNTPSFPSRLGSAGRGGPYYGGVRPSAHPSHTRQVIVPVPIVVGGGYYPYDSSSAGYTTGYADAAPVAQQPVTPPVVIINQSYRPEHVNPVVRDYSDADLPPPSGELRSYEAPVQKDAPQAARRAQPVDDDKPTIYLIAFRDHTILPALAYWVEGDTLNYITEKGTPNRATLSLIDKAFSRQLNSERSVEFSLPD